MKLTKRIAFILAVVMIIAVFPTYGVSAVAIGDTLGNVLNSDIKVFIDDNRIPSYNINNKTVIVAEDLKNYGFDVQWNSANRSLSITSSPGKKITPLKAEDNTKTPGTPAFPYVYTDIVAYVEGRKVESYNVQGKTVIYFADLAVYGTMKWDGTKRHSMLYTKTFTPTYKVGDILGSVLNSNIKAFINDNRIPSYNIANKTVILAEDLRNYGFDVQWNENTKSVYITLNASKAATPLQAENNSKTPGTRAFDYVYTDITTYVNNKKVDSFNLQGKTAIYFASLSDYGVMQWDGGNSHSKLYTLFRVSGKVSMSDNSSASGVNVSLKEKSGGKVVASTTTDSSGNYSFLNVPSANYSVEFTLSGYKNQTSSANVTKGDVTGISTTLYREGVTISGKIYEYGVTNTSGMQGVTVNLRDSGGKIVSTVTSKNDGSYSFENVSSGRYSVEAVKQGYKSTASSLFNADYTDITNKNLSMEYKGITVSGTVYSYETNNVLPNVTVYLKNSSGTTVATTTTASNGTYSFTDVAQGTSYKIEAVLTGYAAASTSAFNVSYNDITGQNVSIRTTGYTLSGTIYASSNSSTTVSGATVRLKNTSGTEIANVTSQYNGSYTFTAVASGTYIIEVSATGYTTTTSSYIDVSANKTQNIYFNSNGNTITGTLTYQYSGSSSVTVTYQGNYYYFTINSSTNTSGFTNYLAGAPVSVTYIGTLSSNAVATSISNSSSSTGTVSGMVTHNSGSYITINTSQTTFYYDTYTSGYGNATVGSQVTITYNLSGSTYYATSISTTGTGTQQITGTFVSAYLNSITINTNSYGQLTFDVANVTKPSHYYNLISGNNVTIYYTGYLSYNYTGGAVVTAIY